MLRLVTFAAFIETSIGKKNRKALEKLNNNMWSFVVIGHSHEELFPLEVGEQTSHVVYNLARQGLCSKSHGTLVTWGEMANGQEVAVKTVAQGANGASVGVSKNRPWANGPP